MKICQCMRRAALAGLAARAWRLLRSRKAARCMTAAGTLLAYVKLRSFLAVDQLVRIYREVPPLSPLFPSALP
jgi:hypothetical protein